MTDSTWEIDAPSLAVTLRWGDTALHTAHLAPPRSFFLGGPSADCALPEAAIGSGRVPLLLAERGALHLVLLPAMDPDGVITAPGRAPRTVADLARPGMATPSLDVPGAFLVELVPGMTADLAIDGVTIAVALEMEAARAVAGHYHVSRRMVPFQIGSAALHLALIAVTALFTRPTFAEDGPSSEQLYYIQQVLRVVAEKEEEALGESDGDDDALGRAFDLRSRNDERNALRRSHRMPLEAGDFSGPYRSASLLALLQQPPTSRDYPDDSAVDEDGLHAATDPRADRFSSFPLDVDVAAGARARFNLQHSELPAPDAVRPDELLNSFDYRYPGPASGSSSPFAVHLDAAPSPFAAGHHLLRVGVQGRQRADGERAHADLARDVGIQVDFNPAAVRSYRLIGYERRSAPRRLRDGDARVLHVGYSVTAVYDVVLANTVSSPVTVRLHHREPRGRAKLEESVVVMAPRSIARSFEQAPPSLRLAAAVAGFAEGLRREQRSGEPRFVEVEQAALAAASTSRDGEDAGEEAQALAVMVRRARSLDEPRGPSAGRGRIADASLMGF
jgi:hypothetical protein